MDTRRLGATIDIEHSHLRFLGHMALNIWDCGGQDIFIQNYFSTQRDHLFRMVEVLIHVFDVTSSEVKKDVSTFKDCLIHLREYSPDAKVFVLVHKMDLMNVEARPMAFTTLMDHLQQLSNGFELTGFATSIWDESLYKAWSTIVCSLIPNMTLFQKHLKSFADVSEAQEVVLFERTTFLVICHVSPDSSQITDGDSEDLDPKRFEKISNYIKAYKQSCSKLRSQLQTFTLHGKNCSAYIDNLTGNTFIMVVMPSSSSRGQSSQGALTSSCDVDGSTVIANIKGSREWFEKIEIGNN